MIDLTATGRPTIQTTVAPTLITEQQVLFSTAAAVALRPAKVGRWAVMRRSMSALFTDSRPPAQRCVARRCVYLEDSVMGRAMYRL